MSLDKGRLVRFSLLWGPFSIIVACTFQPGSFRLQPPRVGDFVPGRLLAKPADDKGLSLNSDDPLTNDPLTKLGIQIIEITIPKGANPRQATLQAWGRHEAGGRYAWVEPDWILSTPLEPPQKRFPDIIAPSLIPNDTYRVYQYGLDRLRLYDAWDLQTGSSSTIAILDTGYDKNHPDLEGKVIREKDYINGDDDATDDHWHGTHVSGIAAAVTGNGRGIAGACPACKLMVCKALSANGEGSVSSVSRCIVWAAGYGADVISLSLGSPQRSQTMEDAVLYAVKQDSVVVAARGNNGNTTPQYPASFRNVIAVAATDANDRRASFSSYDAGVVAAPGDRIISTLPGGSYGYLSGTSMSTPYVAGVVALLRSQYPQMGVLTVRDILESTADRLSPDLGKGRVNAYAALTWSMPTATAPPSPQPTATTVSPSVTPLPTATSLPTATPLPGTLPEEQQMHDLINDYRVANGLSSLRVDIRLVVASRLHSQDMMENFFCGHIGSDGSDPGERMRRQGYPWGRGEIVACGYRSANDAVEAWKNSPGHNKIMLGKYRDIGCGYAGGIFPRYTCDFGNSPSSPEPTYTPRPRATPTYTPQPGGGFWLWCQGRPLICEERVP